MEDRIKIEEGSLTLRYGLDEDGAPTWDVHIAGDVRYLTALGLLEQVKMELRTLYDVDGD